jgi:hypothetical protein
MTPDSLGPRCDECEEASAAAWTCRECSCNLCDDCHGRHERSRRTCHHTTGSIASVFAHNDHTSEWAYPSVRVSRGRGPLHSMECALNSII